MPLFESREAKRNRRQTAIGVAQAKVRQYADECLRMAKRYGNLAKRALVAGDHEAGNRYLYCKLRYVAEANKWDIFLLRMEELALRGGMAGVMTTLLQGLQALNKEIGTGVSTKAIAKVVRQSDRTAARLGQAEERLGALADVLESAPDEPTAGTTPVDVPDRLKQQVEHLRLELLDELRDEGRLGLGSGCEPAQVAIPPN